MVSFTRIAGATMALASLAAAANTVTFVNQDSTTRTIKFTAQSGLAAIDDLTVKGNENGTATIPDSWIGNWYSVSEGADDTPGMLGEVRYNGFSGATYFDVSAIVNPDDTNGVKEIFPKSSETPVSGCQSFPCSNAYNKWDDIATLSTTETDLICLLGTLSTARRGAVLPRMNTVNPEDIKVSRDFVLGQK
jgi:hypothetical protein